MRSDPLSNPYGSHFDTGLYKSPAFDEKNAQEPVPLCQIQRVSSFWVPLHICRQVLSGPKMTRKLPPLFGLKEKEDIDVQLFKCLIGRRRLQQRYEPSIRREGTAPFCIY